jgi:hypothetical protein
MAAMARFGAVVAGRGPELSGGGGMAGGEGQEGGVGEDCGGTGEQGTGQAEDAIQYRGEQRAGADNADRDGDGEAVRPAEHVPRQHPLQAGDHDQDGGESQIQLCTRSHASGSSACLVCATRCPRPLEITGRTEPVPAWLGEAVVLHGFEAEFGAEPGGVDRPSAALCGER